VKYSGYIDKERNNADKLTRLEVKTPEDFDYDKIKSMSIEARQSSVRLISNYSGIENQRSFSK
jgi:tRNA uridine 5-carboxymethylaminomethyl modification enzyme